jgi:antitoxin FitA
MRSMSQPHREPRLGLRITLCQLQNSAAWANPPRAKGALVLPQPVKDFPTYSRLDLYHRGGPRSTAKSGFCGASSNVSPHAGPPRRMGGGFVLSVMRIEAGSKPTPMNLSIKDVPDDVVQRLRQRAKRRHRSLQGELLAIIEEAVRSDRELSPAELLAEVRRLGLRTSAYSADIIRAERDRH